ncbi:peptidoglycan DD-metalloendopeptidase family protein [Nodularia spumigena]|uniref:peptidoglycan DD-metalloendopeptidase family protein n=2 Tax=Nodularia spumigena TaxID=70799 RepID=UPI002330DD57|nr:peptidoglycan DD-metalloendopeptidase family protein [Nodularia spumigena]MDB9317896.1 peptidoglycan DD-metalloendopeptidase family protein [Nodularia spumigena CS-590/01A]MDB9324109.1 peptidoglycan DD-metalloendopeptidase family protein [Nodularia spumigena CS-591/07A]MDB9330989.1 peptidoglycan DD-metalloendopeptidase family protein [Nodularia spumigena CS-591/04]MDB9357638.1 peptidoglycan DD-metalloendopeptidase family protein [Nodularia spumigena CS-587/03]MDB9359455.1 peptidoglycan DD-m
MKRALKKREKAVLKNTPSSDDALVEHLEHLEHLNIVVNPKVKRRVRTKAAMIGLAISMGATSLLVTRQSDQAQAAAPVGSQKAASTIPAASDTTVKFASTTLKTQTVLPASLSENPVIVEPTAISQLPGLEAKWQVAASGMSVPVPVLTSESNKTAANTTSLNLQPPVSQGLSTPIEPNETVVVLSSGDSVTKETGEAQPQALENPDPSGEMNAQLKAQQEFALNRLQEKSHRLRNSLAESRSEETQVLSKNDIALTQPKTTEKAPLISASQTVVEESSNLSNDNTEDLISRLKQTQQTSESNPQALTIPVPATQQIVALLGNTGYEVKPGDTLAAIASRYNISISELVKANHLTNPHQLKISQKLVIPVTPVNRSRAIQIPVAVNSNSGYSSTTPQLANYPVTSANNYPNLPPASSQLPLSGNNDSVSIPIPVTTNNQNQVNVNTVTATQTESISSDVNGLGGDTPIPALFGEMQEAQKSTEQAASTKDNEGLRVLRADIERLQEKHRQQHFGNTTSLAATEPKKAVAPTPIVQTSSLHAEIRKLQEKYRRQESGNTTSPAAKEPETNLIAIPIAQTNSLEADIQNLREQYRQQQSGNTTSPAATEPKTAPIAIPVAQTNSPEAQIQKLREQYRQQQSGNATSPAATEPKTDPIAIPVFQPNNTAAFQPASGQKNAAIPIHVPTLNLPGYGQSAHLPTRTRRANEPINPEFSSSLNASGQRTITTPSGADISDTLGNLRGTRVTPQLRPQLPPLAAVEQYLPKPIDATTPPPSTGSTSYIWPAKGVLTSGYGRRWGRMHRGIDIANATGTPIFAVADGVVAKSGWNRGGYGILVEIRHEDGTMTRYAHNSRTLVRAGQQVTQGQQIANMGSTGFSTGPHTHFEIHPAGKGATDPIAFLPKERL